MYQAVIFDFDGTIADTKEGIIKGAHYALSCCGIKCDIEDERLMRFVGPTLWFSFANFFHLDEQTVHAAVMHYREYYTKEGMFLSKLYDGMLELLKELSKSPILVGIASAKNQKTVEESLIRFGIRDYFDIVYGSLSGGERSDKAELIEYVLYEMNIKDRNEVLFVGDSRTDAIGAIETGVPFAAALYDRNRAEFDGLILDYEVETIEELYGLIWGSSK